jgi:hypothetical protein
MFGEGLNVTPTCQGCASQFITRAGYFVSIAQPGAPASIPAPAPPGLVAQLLAALYGQKGTGGTINPLTDTVVLNSGLPDIISGNFDGSD